MADRTPLLAKKKFHAGFYLLRFLCIPIFVFGVRLAVVALVQLGLYTLLVQRVGMQKGHVYSVFFVIACAFAALLCVCYLKLLERWQTGMENRKR